MDRALNLEFLTGALEDLANLPTPAELRAMLAEAEVAAFFAQAGALDQALLDTAWNLHHVGTVRPALGLYEPERQVQANSVAAHIFDLTLRAAALSPGEQLVTTFAAQVSSIRGDRTPNATALGRRLPAPTALLHMDPGRASLELGCSFLTLDRGQTVSLLRALSLQQREAEARVADVGLNETGLASASGVVKGIHMLQRYMTSGDVGELDQAREAFAAAANTTSSRRDLDSRWVAAHLLDLCDDFGRSSVWAVLPPTTPLAVGRSMTLGDPPVMTLWPPQVEVLSDSATSPLRKDVKRAVLTFPTSAEKTLLAQLLIAEHLANVGTSVCFVAPSHSLCREVREGLDRRLWVLRQYIRQDGPLGDLASAKAPVVVMTPERLAARLRSGEQALLNEFGLFVLDEAHLLDDATRGWTFETTITRLHVLTRETNHRLVLLSAALGGTASVQTWLDVDSPPVGTTSTWRGPRHLHATYVPSEDPSTRVVVAPEGRQKLERIRTEINGFVSLYVDGGREVAVRSTPLGHVVRYGTSKDAPTRAEQLAPIVHHASRSGAVLTVHATKKAAERLAECIAGELDEKQEAAPLVRLAELRLGPTHPLVPVLRKGVAYHHAALPVDLQAEIENAVRAGSIEIVCATTTLTEGINLPVRTVVVCERGYFDGTRFNEFIDATDLMNAAGRAGRAGRETDGWIVVAEQRGGINPREALLGLKNDQHVRSTLNVMSALAELDTYEALLHDTAGVVLTTVPPVVDGFLAYCWYLAEVTGELETQARAELILGDLRQTLAWQQLPEDIRSRWETLAVRVSITYNETEHVKRRRWARSGAPLSANAVLESVKEGASLATTGIVESELSDPLVVLNLLLGAGRLQQLLDLVPERDRRFKRRRFGATELVEVDTNELVADWVRGVGLAELVERHLGEVDPSDDGFRFEQLSTFLSRICEHHLPWTLGTILEWINGNRRKDLCPTLPACVHYGVADLVALELMSGGVRSRRLAVAVAEAASATGVETGELRRWLTNSGVAAWREDFSAGAAEIGDLLQFLYNPTAAIGVRLLNGESVRLTVDPGPAEWENDEALPLTYLPSHDSPQPLGIISATSDVVATIRAAEYRHLAVLLDAGIELLAKPVLSSDPLTAAVDIQASLD